MKVNTSTNNYSVKIDIHPKIKLFTNLEILSSFNLGKDSDIRIIVNNPNIICTI